MDERVSRGVASARVLSNLTIPLIGSTIEGSGGSVVSQVRAKKAFPRCRRTSATAALFAPAVLLGSPSIAAEFSTFDLEKGVTAIVMSGEVVSGDAAKFRQIAARHSRAVLMLQSDGGALAEALDIGETVQRLSYGTAVINGFSCDSACALIWLAGKPRILSRSAQLGFHAAYTLSRSGGANESGVANAMVGRYLTMLNLPKSAVLFATTAPPDTFNYLTAYNATALGIPVKVMADLDRGSTVKNAPPPIVVTPSRPPPLVRTNKKETSVWKTVDPWYILVDHTLADSCFMLASFNNETIFRVGINARDDSFYLLISNPGWTSLQVGKRYPLEFNIDGTSPWDVQASAKLIGKTPALIAEFTDASFWDDVVKGRVLTVTREGRFVTSVSLSGTAAAFAEFVACQKAYNARNSDPFRD